MSRRPIDRARGIVLGVCGHWWQAVSVEQAMELDCPDCRRPPGIYIGSWDETWPEPGADAFIMGSDGVSYGPFSTR